MQVDQVTAVGRTQLQVGRLGFGTVPLGNLYTTVSDAQASNALTAAYDAGIRVFDTAPVYGFGIAEARLGQWLANHSRDDIVISTKVGRLLRTDAPPDPAMTPAGRPLFADTPAAVSPVFDFSYDGALRSLDESLERLGTDHVDIVYIHDPDDHFDEAVAGAYRALDSLRGQGVIAAIGVGMTQTALLTNFVEECNLDCVLLAGRYTLLDASASSHLLPACLARGVAVFLGGVYNSGILADPTTSTTYDYVAAPPEIAERAQRIKDVCDRHNVPIAAAALQFGFRHAAITTVLVGMRSAGEVRRNVALFGTAIPDELWSELAARGLLDHEGPASIGGGT